MLVQLCLICAFYTLPILAATSFQLTNDQLQDVISQLWFSDINRAEGVRQLDLNFQQHTESRNRQDVAPEKLFRKVDPQVLERPTVETLIALFDSYNANSLQDDATTPERRAKIGKFLDEVLKTDTMNVLQTNLQRYGYQTTTDFRQTLLDLWFTDYSRSRGTKGSSSGFEHVFIGEIKNDEVSGLHNWIRYYWLEKRGDINYTGFIIKRKYIAMIQYKWGKYWKPSGSMFLGTSPEFDFAVYTLCFLAKPGENACDFLIGDCTDVQVTSHTYNLRDKTSIGSAFPFPGKVVDNCRVSAPSPVAPLPPSNSTKTPGDIPPTGPDGPTKSSSIVDWLREKIFGKTGNK